MSQAEEYLADHFPTFPVLPGVLMLEAATQAAAWLAFRRTGFGVSMTVLKSGPQRPLRPLRRPRPRACAMTADYDKPTDAGHAFKVEGTVEDGGKVKTAITGKLELACFRLGRPQRRPGGAGREASIERHRARWADLTLSDAAMKLSI